MVAHTARRMIVMGIALGLVCGGRLLGAAAEPVAVEAAGLTAPAAPPEEAGHAAGPASHDPYDLTHANAGPKLADPSEWRYDMSLFTVVVFLLLLILLSFAWTRVIRGLDAREKYIADRMEEARLSAERSAFELKSYQDKMAAAAQEALEVVKQGHKDAEAVAERIRNEAQQEAARERERAIAEIHGAKNAALRDLARRGADLAVTLAGRIVRRELRTDDHVALITEALEQFPSSN